MNPQQFKALIHDLKELAVKHNVAFIWQNQCKDEKGFGSILIPMKGAETGRVIRVRVEKARE